MSASETKSTPSASASAPAAMDKTKLDQFQGKMVEIINGGFLTGMISIGHRTGLFDKMAELKAPTSCAQIAQAAQLNERYVREWLHAMVTARIVEYDATKKLYFLPAEHAAFLTRAASPNNMAVMTQFIAVLGRVEDRLVSCFKNGGGVKYEEYEGFHRVMAEESAQTVLPLLIPHVLPSVKGLVELLRGKPGIRAVDIGCGSGRASIKMAQEFPSSQFLGYDLSPEAVARAQQVVAEQKLSNVTFVVKNVTEWTNEPEAFDLITAFDAIHDQAQPLVVLKNIAHALKPTGVFIMQDIHAHTAVEQNMQNPLAPVLYSISTAHCMSVSLAYNGEGLGTMWGEEKAAEYLKEAGFKDVQVLNFPHEPLNTWFICRKSK